MTAPLNPKSVSEIAEAAAKTITDCCRHALRQFPSEPGAFESIEESFTTLILSAIKEAGERPRIRNQKILDGIAAVIIEHSGNGLLAEEVRAFLAGERTSSKEKTEEHREARAYYWNAIDAIYNDGEAGRALVEKHFGLWHPPFHRKDDEAPVAYKAGDASKQKDGIALIAAERQRQLDVEGWTPENDDAHSGGQLLLAAENYAEAARDQIRLNMQPHGRPFNWPWLRDSWKPSDDPIRNLEKAGALIAAEIDRLIRKAGESEWEYLCADGQWRYCERREDQRTGHATIESNGVQHVVPLVNVRRKASDPSRRGFRRTCYRRTECASGK